MASTTNNFSNDFNRELLVKQEIVDVDNNFGRNIQANTN